MSVETLQFQAETKRLLDLVIHKQRNFPARINFKCV